MNFRIEKTLLLILFITLGCVPIPPEESDFSLNEKFGDYWYQGEAELTSYKLEQARYGEIHEGKAVLIFVTEGFSKKKQVKLDNPETAGDDHVTVMKLNFTKKFDTGIYPYSLMASVFTPVERNKYSNTLKVTASAQEWCGHTFTQLNLKGNQYKGSLKSYFESEGDQELTLNKTFLEDEIWNIIRLHPQSLPTGDFKIIPGTLFQRLKHLEFDIVKASAKLEEGPEESGLMQYHVHFEQPERDLTILFRKEFPHEIISWEESYKDGFGENAPTLTTKATKIETLKTDYWTKHNNEHAGLRKELGLE
ncbi:hypothetical protein [Flexithrix dorotheae]|uniref:hypothetical protein n=1 Tax=Flexithrix dorotheae TaxID=70993 RepID=UPI0003A1458E|nr:hypothetical protein [Flexithrix dorotheae]